MTLHSDLNWVHCQTDRLYGLTSFLIQLRAQFNSKFLDNILREDLIDFDLSSSNMHCITSKSFFRDLIILIELVEPLILFNNFFVAQWALEILAKSKMLKFCLGQSFCETISLLSAHQGYWNWVCTHFLEH